MTKKTTITYITLSAITTFAIGLFAGWMLFQPNEQVQPQEVATSVTNTPNSKIRNGENGAAVQMIQSCMFIKGDTPEEISENADAVLSSEISQKLENVLTANQQLGIPYGVCMAKNSELLLTYRSRNVSPREEDVDGLLAIPVPIGDPTFTLVLSDLENNEHRASITAAPGTTCQVSHEGYLGPKHVQLHCETSSEGYYGMQLFDWNLSTDTLDPLRRCARTYTYNNETKEFRTIDEQCKEDEFSFAPFTLNEE